MSGERVEAIKRRALIFLELGEELLSRDVLDVAAFNLYQACQLRIKASLLRFRGEIPGIHSLRELLGILSTTTELRYGLAPPARRVVDEVLGMVKKLFNLLDIVERHVLG